MKYQIINGKLLKKEEALIPLNDLGMLRGFSVFDYFRVLQGIPIFFEDHMDRLKLSADKMGLMVPWSRDEIKSMVTELISANEATEAGFRIIATGGFSDDGYTPADANVYMSMHILPTYPEDDFKFGRKIIASNFMRELPEIKTTMYVNAVKLQKRMKAENAIEILYHNNGAITECSRSNIFFVDQDGNVLTSPDKVLQGITRKHAIALAKSKFPVIERTVQMDEIPNMKEVFITSSTRGVMPVIAVEDIQIADGKVGKITAELHEMFKANITEYIDQHLPN